MDFNKLAQDVLAAAGQAGILSEDLEKTEERLRDFLLELGRETLQLHMDGQQKLGCQGSRRTGSGWITRSIGSRGWTLDQARWRVRARTTCIIE